MTPLGLFAFWCAATGFGAVCTLAAEPLRGIAIWLFGAVLVGWHIWDANRTRRPR